MHNLVIDIGNTKTKMAVFKQNKIVFYQASANLRVEDILACLDKYPIRHSIVSNVKHDEERIIQLLKNKTKYIRFSTKVKAGIINQYTTPRTLGLDRWAKVIAASKLYPNTTCVLVDAGTCLTYDVLTENNEYLGGSISPGMRMRFKALHEYTVALPLIDWAYKNKKIPKGRDTETAILSGVLYGFVNEIKSYIAQKNEEYQHLKVLITGGDADFLRYQLKNSIFVPQIVYDNYLVLKGLNEVIKLKHV